MNKENKTHVSGNQNIVIQDVNANNITINVGGKEQKLETAMNQWLVQNVVEKIAPYNEIAQSFMKNAESVENWQTETKYRKVALIIMQSAYVGVVGNYIKRLAAISNDTFSVEKLKNYIFNAYFLALRLLDFMNITLISQLWEYTSDKKIEIDDKNKKIISQFFRQSLERDIKFSFELFSALFDIYKKNALDFPMPEIANLENSLAGENELAGYFSKIEERQNNLQKQEPNAEDGFWVENALTNILIQFSFLAKYKIQAVKEVDYHQIKTLQEFFLHKTNLFGLSPKETEQNKAYSQKIAYSDKKIPTDAILVYSENYINGLNIFPFAIDYNNILKENDTVICFFSHRDLTDENQLNFVSVEDNALIGILKTEDNQLKDVSNVYADKKLIIRYKKNIIVELLNKAEEAILGKPENENDLLNSLMSSV